MVTHVIKQRHISNLAYNYWYQKC